MSAYNAFAIQSVAEMPANLHIEPTTVSLDNLAIDAMHTLNVQAPHMLDVETSIDEALLILKRTHNRTSVVVDSYNNMLGLISKARLTSSYVLKAVAKTGLSRKDLTVGDLMISKANLKCVTDTSIKSARVVDVLKMLESEGHEHLLVVNAQSKTVIGYFDLIDMAKMVGRPLSQFKRAKSFTEIVDSLWHHNEI
ncbi:CBS domain-containing protein [Pseudoalteromonas xiamenensis]|uniref:CBS domain-containing protein n=1 Tax=Pseudoalteromonas xiamenensis TaxID=882626 RepID=UPI0027E4A0CC|nr:CBS domain-containing protein [Pseudoalteromonas xiamenensis]WMN59458.1 CBS domain-containing protein [Pseudoalteromonas xiamenensis]